jgi:hypothetical protein
VSVEQLGLDLLKHLEAHSTIASTLAVRDREKEISNSALSLWFSVDPVSAAAQYAKSVNVEHSKIEGVVRSFSDRAIVQLTCTRAALVGLRDSPISAQLAPFPLWC